MTSISMLLLLYYYKCHTYFNSFSFPGIFVRKVTISCSSGSVSANFSGSTATKEFHLFIQRNFMKRACTVLYWRHSQIKSEINAAKLINSSLQSSSFMLFTRSFLPSFRIHMPNIWRSYMNNKGLCPVKNTSLYTNDFLL